MIAVLVSILIFFLGLTGFHLFDSIKRSNYNDYINRLQEINTERGKIEDAKKNDLDKKPAESIVDDLNNADAIRRVNDLSDEEIDKLLEQHTYGG